MRSSIQDLEKLLRLPYVEPDGGFSISPDGSQVAFAWNPAGSWQIYLAPLDEPGTPRQITFGPGAKTQPRWSPDGRYLAYLVDLDGSERHDLFIFDFELEKHNNLTPDTPEAIHPGYCWSPDSEWIAFTSNRSGRFNTYILPRQGGPARQALDLPHPERQVRWSPDGRWLAITYEASGQDHETCLVPLAGGAPIVLSDATGPVHASQPCWSPDSKKLAFSSNLHGSFDLGIYDLEEAGITWVVTGDCEYASPAWSPNGRRLAFTAQKGPASKLAVLDLESSQLEEFQVQAGIHSLPEFTTGGERLVFLFENPCQPSGLWLLSLADGGCQQITRSLPDDLPSSSFVLPVETSYPGLDGRQVPALLFTPHEVTGPYNTGVLPPAVVFVHGGPNWLTRMCWEPAIQHMLSRGWVVLAPNYRGSTGYGRDWQLANRFDLGKGDAEDIVAGADYLASHGLADPQKIAVTGRSYGGYLTMVTLTRFPERWAAGSAVVPFINWFTGHRNSREDLQHWDLENFGHPEKDHDLYYARSPYFFLDRLRAPVQLICGENDPRCPASESVQARDALAGMGKPCDLALFLGEGHHFLNTENEIAAQTRRIEFLSRALESTS